MIYIFQKIKVKNYLRDFKPQMESGRGSEQIPLEPIQLLALKCARIIGDSYKLRQASFRGEPGL